MSQPASERAFHLLPEGVWAAHAGREDYLPEAYEQEGFIHCTTGEAELLATANRYYRDDARPFLLLEVDLQRLTVPVLVEDESGRYPHIYGPIARHAVIAVHRLERGDSGEFIAIGDLFD